MVRHLYIGDLVIDTLDTLQTVLHTFFFMILPLSVAVAMMSDYRSMTISNEISITIAVAFFPTAFLAGLPLWYIGDHLLFGIVMFIVGVILFVLNVYGGGDAKLIAAVSLWIGYNIIEFLLIMAIAGGFLGIAGLLLRETAFGRRLMELPSVQSAVSLEGLKKKRIPYGLAIGYSVFWVLGKLSTAPW